VVEKVVRTRSAEAKRVLADELKNAGWDAVSACTIEKKPRIEAQDLSWWHQNTPPGERSETLRNLSYLRAYIKIAQSERLAAQGIQIEGARLWMDRSVISRLERDGYLKFDDKPTGAFEPMFELTDAGREWIKK